MLSRRSLNRRLSIQPCALTRLANAERGVTQTAQGSCSAVGDRTAFKPSIRAHRQTPIQQNQIAELFYTH